MGEISVNAYAKINLALDVLMRRPDGYHEVRMIMQAVQVFDRVTVKLVSKPGILIRSNLQYLPKNENNIAYKAAQLFCKEQGIDAGIFINLDKHIPVSAGLAGGSSDAAAVLKGLNELCETGLDLKELQEMGVHLGADVPYCLMGGTALSEGIGEKLTPLRSAPQCWCLLVKPSVSVSTESVYKGLVLNKDTIHPDVDRMLKSIEEGSLDGMAASMGNLLETVTEKRVADISEIKKKMMEEGALNSLMSGSGPTVFGIFDDRRTAEKAFYQFKVSKYGKQCFLTQFKFAQEL